MTQELLINYFVAFSCKGSGFCPSCNTRRMVETAVAQVQADVRRRILRAFVGRGLLESFDAKEMPAYPHSGFSVDAGVCIQSQDRAGLERLLRYCARPPFAMDRLRQRGADLVYHCPNPQTGGKQADLVLTPLDSDGPHRRTGATAAHAPPPLLWCAGRCA